MTVQCTQRGENNVCVRECRFAGHCERKFSIQNQPLSEQSASPVFVKKSSIVDEELQSSNENLKQTIDDFLKKKKKKQMFYPL